MWSTAVAWVVQRGPCMRQVLLSRRSMRTLVRFHSAVDACRDEAVRGLRAQPLVWC
ncbi:hypothetical protein [Mycobacteroides abscessus]|uniref:hypothetical protein n=1 Tax=Mycobacteroides abscessus TaxID=36809 RepID=UPI001F413507|nr:hypothetical protein [Mycobacteroides abscessus]MDO3270648.1 hypothetical protein [Mycobacteroides abscessus subsp. abscessus]